MTTTTIKPVQDYTFTLAKAHIIEQKLKQAFETLSTDLLTDKVQIQQDLVATEEKVKEQNKDFLSRLHQATVLNELIEEIREKIAKENMNCGIHSLLTRVDRSKKFQRFLENLIRNQKGETIQDGFEKAKRTIAESEQWKETGTDVGTERSLNVLSRFPLSTRPTYQEDLERFEDALKQIRRDESQQQDQISALNHSRTIEIRIPADLADLIDL